MDIMIGELLKLVGANELLGAHALTRNRFHAALRVFSLPESSIRP